MSMSKRQMSAHKTLLLFYHSNTVIFSNIACKNYKNMIAYLVWQFAIYAQIAQLVEQRTENPRVAGSIPALGIFVARSNEIIE